MDNKERLINEVKNLYKKIRDKFNSEELGVSPKIDPAEWKDLVEKAGQLHKIVKPKHHKYMLKNRGVKPGDPEFYNHLDPIEDLLKFIDNPHANDDPEDQTIGVEFRFSVYTRRWKHEDPYRIKRTKTGWEVSHISIGGVCNKKCQPFLFRNLEHDSINYPEDLPGYFEWLWDEAKESGLSKEKVQESLNELAGWVSVCEKSSPEGIWKGYK